jgi:hypothetical protein
MVSKVLTCLICLFIVQANTIAAEPLHRQIDLLILEKAKGKPVSPLASDDEFIRRVYLDFAGRIPTTSEASAFLADQAPDKRAWLIEKLLAGPDYGPRLADLFHVMLMERLGEHPEWSKYLTASFAANKPWDQLVREILRADDQAARGAAFFIAKRLDKVGEQPIDYPGLTRDIGRLFLGKNLQCAQCHDHLFIDEYKQEHFQGLFAYVQNVYIVNMAGPSVAEKLTTEKISFMSVFKKINKQTGPALPGGNQTEIPVFKKGEEFIKAPDPRKKIGGVPRFSTLALLAEQLPSAQNPDFARNIVNRLWFVAMGRGLVHPLDFHHKDNPPSHPELLDLLAREFVAHQFDIKWFLGELARTETYQRASALPKGVDKPARELFLTAIERKLSAQQLMWSILEASGERQRHLTPKRDDGLKVESIAELQTKFVKAFGNPAREPEEEASPSLKAALFLLNNATVLDWLTPRPGNLIERLSQIADDEKTADELYLSVLTRRPSSEERQAVRDYLKQKTANRASALSQLAWSLLASTEFSVNH